MLGREPVIDEHHGARRALGELAAQRVGLVDRADHPAATVVVDDHPGGGLDRHEYAQAHVAVGALERVLLDARHGRRGPAERGQTGAVGPCLLGRAFLKRFGVGVGPVQHLRDEACRRRVQCHAVLHSCLAVTADRWSAPPSSCSIAARPVSGIRCVGPHEHRRRPPLPRCPWGFVRGLIALREQHDTDVAVVRQGAPSHGRDLLQGERLQPVIEAGDFRERFA